MLIKVKSNLHALFGRKDVLIAHPTAVIVKSLVAALLGSVHFL